VARSGDPAGTLCSNARDGHKVIAAYFGAIQRYQLSQIKVNNLIKKEVGPCLGPALLVFYFQLLLCGWFEERWRFNDTNNTLDFNHCFYEVNLLHMGWLPGYKNIPVLAALMPNQAGETPPPVPHILLTRGGGASWTIM
jgi:hypothetical protein